MKLFKRTASWMLTLVLVLSLSAFQVDAAPQTYSTVSNSGTRHEVCTTLDGTTAGTYYTDSYTYDALSALSADALLTSLRQLMKTTHTKNSYYSDCRDMAVKTDCENNDGRIVTLYTSYSATYGEYNSGNGWNREHVWPKSLGGFDTSGAGADLHHIRPSENRTNSQRGNKKYGNVSSGSSSTGNLSGLVGGTYSTYYEPLDNVKGDVARICLYVYVRYGGELSKCSKITNVFESVDVLLQWCALDPVDTWEMGRNEVVAAYQGNRNVFIDYPELAWLIFGEEVPNDMVTPSGEAYNTIPCSHDSTETRNAKAATCSAEGYTGDTYCTICNRRIATGKAIPTTPHTEVTVITEPTCTENGKQVTMCDVCKKVLQTTVLSATGHSDVDGNHLCDKCGYDLTPPPTEPPTEPPTVPPTEPPTEPPTQPPTEPPTEPTDPVPDVTDPTDPTDPEVTDPTEPEVTDPTEPEVTDPTDPATDPTDAPTQPSGTAPGGNGPQDEKPTSSLWLWLVLIAVAVIIVIVIVLIVKKKKKDE